MLNYNTKRLLFTISLIVLTTFSSCTKDEDEKKGCDTKTITLPDGSTIEQPIPGTCNF